MSSDAAAALTCARDCNAAAATVSALAASSAYGYGGGSDAACAAAARSAASQFAPAGFNASNVTSALSDPWCTTRISRAFCIHRSLDAFQ